MLNFKNISLAIACVFYFGSCRPASDWKTKDAKPEEQPTQAKKITSFDQWFENPTPLVSAHRGGPYPGFPENAIETFENIAVQTATIIECDVSMTKDSVLILMHDKTLDRTTTGAGYVADQTYKEVSNLFLIDLDGAITTFRIPTLDEALSWGRGKILFTLDVKRGVPFSKVITSIEHNEAASYAAIITYNFKDAEYVYSSNEEIVISVSAGDEGALQQIVRSGIPATKLLGFVGTREPELTHYEKLQKLGIKTILGTLGNLDKSAIAKGNDQVYLTYVKNGAYIIATDRPLEVAAILGTTF